MTDLETLKYPVGRFERLKAPLDLKTVTAPEYREKALQVLGH